MEKEQFSYVLTEKAKKIGIDITQKDVEKFYKYINLLLEWNEKINLTAITEPNEVILKHFIDSITINKYLKEANTIMDIGTGAGFPGIPLKIAFPHLKVVLLDSLNKRINFLNTVIEELGLENVETLHGRAEDYAKKAEYREQADLCVSRAVANLSTLSEYCLPYVKVDGKFIPYKSGEITTEADEAKKAVGILGGNVKKILKFHLPDSDITRSFVVIEKKKATPKKYPRKAGLPSREPLK